MRIKITQPGIYDGAGKEIEVGTEVDLKEEPTGWAGRYETISGGSDDDGKTFATGGTNATGGNGQGGDATPVFKVVETSPGWFVVTKDGTPATKRFRKADLDGFETLSDEDKAAFVEANKAED